MIRLYRYCLFLLAMFSGSAVAGELNYDGSQLQLKDEARACWLKFIKLYDISYYADPASQARCVQVSYLRDFSTQQLDEATRKVFRQANGEELSSRYSTQLEQIGSAYDAVKPGDSYQYCIGNDRQGELSRDGSPVIELTDQELAGRFLKIWISDIQQGKVDWNFSSC